MIPVSKFSDLRKKIPRTLVSLLGYCQNKSLLKVHKYVEFQTITAVNNNGRVGGSRIAPVSPDPQPPGSHLLPCLVLINILKQSHLPLWNNEGIFYHLCPLSIFLPSFGPEPFYMYVHAFAMKYVTKPIYDF